MITRENIKTVLSNLHKEEIETALNGDGDYVLVWLHTFNTGSFTTINSYDYDEDVEKEATDNGMLFIDKDDFLRLLTEVGL